MTNHHNQVIIYLTHMSRERKDAKLLNIKLDRKIHEQLEKFCAESGMTKTTATEKILSQYFDEYFRRPEYARKLFP